MEDAEPPSYVATHSVAEIATRRLFGEGLSQMELLELCTAVLREIARLRRLDLVRQEKATGSS